MATIRTTFKLKRGFAAEWNELNPILCVGEPGFEIDTGRLKIGNGIATWSEINYQDELSGSVHSAPTRQDFPALGNATLLYFAYTEKQLYCWVEESNNYVLLSFDGSEFVTWQSLETVLAEIANKYASQEELQSMYNSIVPLTEAEILELCSKK